MWLFAPAWDTLSDMSSPSRTTSQSLLQSPGSWLQQLLLCCGPAKWKIDLKAPAHLVLRFGKSGTCDQNVLDLLAKQVLYAHLEPAADITE